MCSCWVKRSPRASVNFSFGEYDVDVCLGEYDVDVCLGEYDVDVCLGNTLWMCVHAYVRLCVILCEGDCDFLTCSCFCVAASVPNGTHFVVLCFLF